MPASSRRVLGVDPGYERLGVAVVERVGNHETVLYSDCINTTARTPYHERLRIIGETFARLIAAHQPSVVALEKLFVTKNQKTATKVSEVRGVLIYVSAAAGIPLVEFTPQEIKQTITGHGGADKQQMMSMIAKLVKLPEKSKRLDDEFDAIGVALTALARPATPDLSTQ